jgi:hypothetical protein
MYTGKRKGPGIAFLLSALILTHGLCDRWFRKLNAQRKAEEEARDLQFKKDAFWARRGRGQETTTVEVAHTEPPRMRRTDVRTKLLFRATMEEDLLKIRSLVQAGVKWQSVTNKAGQTPQEVAEVAGKKEAIALYDELRKQTQGESSAPASP